MDDHFYDSTAESSSYFESRRIGKVLEMILRESFDCPIALYFKLSRHMRNDTLMSIQFILDTNEDLLSFEYERERDSTEKFEFPIDTYTEISIRISQRARLHCDMGLLYMAAESYKSDWFCYKSHPLIITSLLDVVMCQILYDSIKIPENINIIRLNSSMLEELIFSENPEDPIDRWFPSDRIIITPMSLEEFDALENFKDYDLKELIHSNEIHLLTDTLCRHSNDAFKEISNRHYLSSDIFLKLCSLRSSSSTIPSARLSKKLITDFLQKSIKFLNSIKFKKHLDLSRSMPHLFSMMMNKEDRFRISCKQLHQEMIKIAETEVRLLSESSLYARKLMKIALECRDKFSNYSAYNPLPTSRSLIPDSGTINKQKEKSSRIAKDINNFITRKFNEDIFPADHLLHNRIGKYNVQHLLTCIKMEHEKWILARDDVILETENNDNERELKLREVDHLISELYNCKKDLLVLCTDLNSQQHTVTDVAVQVMHFLRMLRVAAPGEDWSGLIMKANHLISTHEISFMWNMILRIKGEAYEKCFGATHGLTHTDERLKPTLLDLIRVYFPDKLSVFQDAICGSPEIANLTPDFHIPGKVNSEISIRVKRRSESPTQQSDEENNSDSTKSVVINLNVETQLFKAFEESEEKRIKSIKDMYQASSKCSRDSYVVNENGNMKDEDCNLVVIEVGCNVLPAEKLHSDHQKWSLACRILKEKCDINTVYFGFVENSSSPAETWKIDMKFAKLFHQELSSAISWLQAITPAEISSKVSRSILMSGDIYEISKFYIMTTPISDSDLKKNWCQKLANIQNRPLGENLDLLDVADLYSAASYQYHLDPSVTDNLISSIVESHKMVLNQVSKDDGRKVEVIDFSSGLKFMNSWIGEDLKFLHSSDCINKYLRQRMKDTQEGTLSRAQKFDNLLSQQSILLEMSLSKLSCRCSSSLSPHQPKVRSRIGDILSNVQGTDLYLISTKEDTPQRVSSTKLIFDDDSEDETEESSDADDLAMEEEATETTLDEMCKIHLPARTKQERSTRSQLHLLIIKYCQLCDIDCIKHRGGQLLFVRGASSKETTSEMHFSLNKKTARDVDPMNRKEDKILISDINSLVSELTSGSSTLTDYQKVLIGSLVIPVNQSMKDVIRTTSKCCLDKEKMVSIIQKLGLSRDSEGIVQSYLLSNLEPVFKAGSDDRGLLCDSQDIKSYLETLIKDLSWWNNIPACEPVLIEENIRELIRSEFMLGSFRPILDGVEDLVGIMSKIACVKSAILYSSICATFLKMISDGGNAGVKIYRIRPFNINLVCKIPRSKGGNCLSMICDETFSPLGKRFFLTRRGSVLGQAFPQVLIMITAQNLQNYRCFQGLSLLGRSSAPPIINQQIIQHIEELQGAFIAMTDGDMDASWREISVVKNVDALTLPKKELCSQIISRTCASIVCILGFELLRNSQVFNKQIQTIRYPYMLSISEWGFPKALGEKMSAPTRRIETLIAQLWMKLVCQYCLKDPEHNLKQWKEKVDFPDSQIASLSCFGMEVPNGRGFTTEMYLVHIYNKEIDDFAQGSIRVLEDFAERHFSWEKDLANNAESLRNMMIALKDKEQEERSSSSAGTSGAVSNIPSSSSSDSSSSILSHKSADFSNCTGLSKSMIESRLKQLQIERAHLLGYPEAMMNSKHKVERIIKDFRTLKVQSDYDMNDSPLNIKELKRIAKVRINHDLAARSEKTSADEDSTESSTEIKPGPSKRVDFLTMGRDDFDEMVVSTQIKDYMKSVVYKPSKKKFLKSLMMSVKDCPNHSKASSMMIQLAAECFRRKFINSYDTNIRITDTNLKTLSDLSETTSIITETQTSIGLSKCLDILISASGSKLAKEFLKNKERTRDPESNKIRISEELLNNLMITNPGIGLVGRDANKRLKGSSVVNKNYWKEVGQDVFPIWQDRKGETIYMYIKSLNMEVNEIVRTSGYSEVHRSKIEEILGGKHLTLEEYQRAERLEDLLKALYHSTSEEHEELFNNMWRELSWIISERILKLRNPNGDAIKEGVNRISGALRNLATLNLKRNRDPLGLFYNDIQRIVLEEDYISSVTVPVLSFIMEIYIACSLMNPLMLYTRVAGLEALSKLTSTEVEKVLIEGMNSKLSCTSIVISVLTRMYPQLKEEFDCSVSTEELGWSTLSSLWMNTDFIESVIQNPKTKLGTVLNYILNCGSGSGRPIKNLLSDYHGTSDYSVSSVVGSLGRVIEASTFGNVLQCDIETVSIVNAIKSGNMSKMMEIFGKSMKKGVPKSKRSKVIIEMLNKLSSASSAVIQTLAYKIIKDTTHRNYAGLAPKAQYGGDRDLLVQEVNTKLVNSTSEAFAESLLKLTKTDGMTNPKLSTTFLEGCVKESTEAHKVHGSPVPGPSELTSHFRRTFIISGDHKKWGPKHCCMHFNSMYAQLLRDHKDIYNFMSCVMLKSLEKQIEIPAASIEKVLKSFISSELFEEKFLNPNNITQLKQALKKLAPSWKWSSVVPDLILHYISKDRMVLNSYSHMGQGIHHKTSSVLTACLAVLTEEIAKQWFKGVWPNLELSVTHAGSSDDFAKIYVLSGNLKHEEFLAVEEEYKHRVADFLNLLFSIHASCQCKVSEKTVIGSGFGEFYSTFSTFHMVSPSLIKFFTSQIINFSIVESSDIVQGSFANSQQAMIQSVPLMTNVLLSTFRTSIIYNTVQEVLDQCPFVLKAVSPFGGFLIPKFSNLICGGVLLYDLKILQNSVLAALEESKNNLRPLRARSTSNISNKTDEDALSLIDFDEDEYSNRTRSMSAGFDAMSEISSVLSRREVNRPAEAAHDELANNTLEFFNRIDLTKPSYKANPMVLDNSDKLNLLALSYYRNPLGLGIDKPTKAESGRKYSSFISNPFARVLMPEIAKHCKTKNEILKKTYREEEPSNNMEAVLDEILVNNASTCSPSIEFKRIQKALSGTKVALGLSGATKELSLPTLRRLFFSHLFLDKTGLCRQDKWKGTTATAQNIQSGFKTRYLTFLRSVKESIFLECEYQNCKMCKEVENCIGADSDPYDAFRWFSESDVKPVQVVKSSSMTKGGILIVHTSILRGFNICLSTLIRPLQPDFIEELTRCEAMNDPDVRESDPLTVYKAVFQTRHSQHFYKNDFPVLACYILNAEALRSRSVKGVNYDLIAQESAKFSNEYPNIYLYLQSLKTKCSTEKLENLLSDINLLSGILREIKVFSKTGFVMHLCNESGKALRESTFTPLISLNSIEGLKISGETVMINMSTTTDKVRFLVQILSAILHCVRPANSTLKELLVKIMDWEIGSEDVSGNKCQDFCNAAIKRSLTVERTSFRNLLIREISHLPEGNKMRKALNRLISTAYGEEESSSATVHETVAKYDIIGNLFETGTYIHRVEQDILIASAVDEKIILISNSNKEVFLSAAILGLYHEMLRWISKKNTGFNLQKMLEMVRTCNELEECAYRMEILEINHREVEGSSLLKFTSKGDERRRKPALLVDRSIETSRCLSLTKVEKRPNVIRWDYNKLSIIDQISWTSESAPNEDDSFVLGLEETAAVFNIGKTTSFFGRDADRSEVIREQIWMPREFDEKVICIVHAFLSHSGIHTIRSRNNPLKKKRKIQGLFSSENTEGSLARPVADEMLSEYVLAALGHKPESPIEVEVKAPHGNVAKHYVTPGNLERILNDQLDKGLSNLAGININRIFSMDDHIILPLIDSKGRLRWEVRLQAGKEEFGKTDIQGAVSGMTHLAKKGVLTSKLASMISEGPLRLKEISSTIAKHTLPMNSNDPRLIDCFICLIQNLSFTASNISGEVQFSGMHNSCKLDVKPRMILNRKDIFGNSFVVLPHLQTEYYNLYICFYKNDPSLIIEFKPLCSLEELKTIISSCYRKNPNMTNQIKLFEHVRSTRYMTERESQFKAEDPIGWYKSSKVLNELAKFTSQIRPPTLSWINSSLAGLERESQLSNESCMYINNFVRSKKEITQEFFSGIVVQRRIVNLSARLKNWKDVSEFLKVFTSARMHNSSYDLIMSILRITLSGEREKIDDHVTDGNIPGISEPLEPASGIRPGDEMGIEEEDYEEEDSDLELADSNAILGGKEKEAESDSGSEAEDVIDSDEDFALAQEMIAQFERDGKI